MCVLRDNVGQVQGLLIEFLLTFHIQTPNQNKGELQQLLFSPSTSSLLR